MTRMTARVLNYTSKYGGEKSNGTQKTISQKCKFIGKSNERILCKLDKSEILRLYSIVHGAMETTETSYFTCQSKS